MKKWNARLRTWMMDNAYGVTLGCIMAIVIGCAMYTKGMRREVQAAADAPEIHATAQPTHTPTVTPLPTIAPLAVRPAVLVQRGGAWPVMGKTLRVFDEQQSVYWETLGLWQAHMGMDIGAQAGESVRACIDGTVERVSWDAMWGWRVSISHDEGRETRYAGLENCLVQPGMHVQRGQSIGTLMESIPCEAEMGTHLHLEMLREGKHQDPEAMLEEKQ